MRVKPGATVEETVALMTGDQKKALRRVVTAKEVEASTTVATKAKIREALDTGVPASIISASIGVSAKRIYQIRDEALLLL